jgi:hypothetical protein
MYCGKKNGVLCVLWPHSRVIVEIKICDKKGRLMTEIQRINMTTTHKMGTPRFSGYFKTTRPDFLDKRIITPHAQFFWRPGYTNRPDFLGK